MAFAVVVVGVLSLTADGVIVAADVAALSLAAVMMTVRVKVA
jgi:hypothetical protein